MGFLGFKVATFPGKVQELGCLKFNFTAAGGFKKNFGDSSFQVDNITNKPENALILAAILGANDNPRSLKIVVFSEGEIVGGGL